MESLLQDDSLILQVETAKPKQKKKKSKKLSAFLKPGELYCLSKKLAPTRKNKKSTDSQQLEEVEQFMIVPANKQAVPVFFEFSHDFPFKEPVGLPYETPLVYLGIEEKWNARIHVFLYGTKKLFTLGVFNSAPISYWKKIIT